MGKVYNIVYRYLQQTGWDTLYLYLKGKQWRKAKQNILRFLGDDVSKIQIRKYQRQMTYAYLRYGWKFDEYFMFHFSRLSHKGRMEFVPDLQKDYFCRVVNPPAMHDIFTDKGATYNHFSSYYKRDVCPVRSWENDQKKFISLISSHDKYIIKPLEGYMGSGVQIIQGKSIEEMRRILHDEYPSGFISEELIQQDEKMAMLHPSSVNTIRITTLRLGGKIHIINPFVRMGRGEDVVDNAAQGGIFAVIDKETGIITETSDELGNKYVIHPDTGTPIVGFTIPQWKEALALSKELSDVLPECRMVGWDLAYTKNGWVVVEGNSKAQFICFQIATQRGFRKELESLLGTSLKSFCRQKALL